jgi:hypothetical protein
MLDAKPLCAAWYPRAKNDTTPISHSLVKCSTWRLEVPTLSAGTRINDMGHN